MYIYPYWSHHQGCLYESTGLNEYYGDSLNGILGNFVMNYAYIANWSWILLSIK